MIKTIIIICEGETEVEFCSLLYDFLGHTNYRIEPRNLEGNCHWVRIKNLVEKSLKAQKSAIVTTMIDYYGRKENTFPKQTEANVINDIRQKVDFLEQAMKDAIDSSLRDRFIPYLQLHEFEAMLFNNYEVFDSNFVDDECEKNEIQKILQQFPDPEMINDSPLTSPSHRLEKIISGYDKIVYGNLLVESIGLYNICEKNLHFKEWIDKIKSK